MIIERKSEKCETEGCISTMFYRIGDTDKKRCCHCGNISYARRVHEKELPMAKLEPEPWRE